MPKRLVISGYYGFNNAGDDAVLFGMVRALRDLSPDLELLVLSHNPAATAASLPVRAVDRWSLQSIWRELGQADLLISGGGSLWQDVTGVKSLLYYLAIPMLARLRGKPFLVYGQGVGPLGRRWGRWLTGRVADRAAGITVRDDASRQLLGRLGVRRPRVAVTADPVLGLDPAGLDLKTGRQRLASLRLPAGPRVALAVRAWPGQANLCPLLAQLADHLVERGWQAVFLPMQFPDDVAACRQVADRMRQPAPVWDEYLHTEDLLGFLSGCQLVAGMRLHALIMATVLGIPSVAIPYDPKVLAFAGLAGQPCSREPATLTLDDLLAKTIAATADLEGYGQRAAAAAANLRPLALANARLALEILARK